MAPPASVIGALRRRPRITILAFTASVLAAVAALEIADLWSLHGRALQAADGRARNLAYVLSEYVRDSFAVADSSLRQLAIHARRVGGPQAAASEWMPMLTAAQGSLAGHGSITVTDATGRIVHSTQPVIVGQSRADTYIFKRLAEASRDDLIVDRPFPTVTDPRRFIIPLGRRLTRRDGGFDGMVVASIRPDVYREFFRTVDVGRDGMTWVFHPEGIVLFREPSPGDPIGEPAADHPLLRAALASSGDGVVRGPIRPGGPVLVSAFRRLATPPVVVAVSLDEREVLADWRHERRVSAIAFAVLTVTLGLMVIVLFEQMRSTARVERELSDLQGVESARLREANERLEASLEREQRARRESEAANTLKDEFLMTVSHELRTPLTAIYGWVRMLRSDTIPVDQRARAIAAIERNALVQTRLIDELIDVSRGTSGKLRIDAHPVQVADVVRAAADTLAPAISAKSIRFEAVLDPVVGAITADPDRLQQIVWNLLANAVKFTADGGSVELRLSRRGGEVEIAVSDTGAGIEPAFLPHVFEPFRQGEAGTRRRYGGLGLGLAIVRHLVELHGGSVTAESAGEGQGSTFRVRLPVALADQPLRDGAPAVPVARARPSGRLDGIRVLVVDDEPEARELFASILAGAGAVVVTAASAGDARRVLASEPVDVLLSDIEMPGEDGYELLRRALDGRRAGGAPLIAVAVTAYARTVDRRRALDAGFDEHVAKPVDPDTLVATIASLLASAVRS